MRARLIVLLATVTLTAGLVSPATASPGIRSGGVLSAFADTAPAPSSAAAAAGDRVGQTVTLVTGDRVHIAAAPDGEPVPMILPADRSRVADFVTMHAGDHTYVFPVDALPYLGHPLDPSLFDVTTLSGNPGTQLAIAGTNHVAVPGLAVPGLAGPGLAVPGSAAAGMRGTSAFGAALFAQWQHDRRSGNYSGGIFAGVTSISLRGTGTGTGTGTTGTAGPLSTHGASPAASGYRLHTLHVAGLDRHGRPLEGASVVAYNVDDGNLYIGQQIFFHGRAAFSVPEGHYEVVSYIPSDEPGNTTSYSLVTQPQVDVGGETWTTLDARRSRFIGAHTPRPSQLAMASLDLERAAVQGPFFSTMFTSFGATSLYAAPTSPVTIGTLGWIPQLRLGDASGSTDKYLYDIEFPTQQAIPVDLDPTVTTAQLATVPARYPSFVSRESYESRISRVPWQLTLSATSSTVDTPLARTEYVMADPQIQWWQSVVADQNTFNGWNNDRWRTFTSGLQHPQTWFGPAEHPGAQQEILPVGQMCPLCRSGDTLSFAIWPWIDNSPGHWALNDAPVGDGPDSATLSLYQGGSLLGQLTPPQGTVDVSPDPATYQVVVDTQRQTPWWQLSTQTHTVWTFASRERAPDPLPTGWTCGGKGGGGREVAATPDGPGGGSTQCSVEPLLLVDYSLHAGMHETLPAHARSAVTLDIHRQMYGGATRLSRVTVFVSFDDGATWIPAPASATEPGGHRYIAHFTTPRWGAGAGFVSFRVQARDESGSRVDQTILRAVALPWGKPSVPAGTTPRAPQPRPGANAEPACAAPTAPADAMCFALIRTDAAGMAAAVPNDGTQAGYGPADLRDAYKLSAAGGSGQTIAVVDAYDDPNAESDLAAYRAAYGLPPCTSANGCFRKVNERGHARALPNPDTGWSVEISLDLDMASAICPKCRLLLVEADSPSVFDLGPSVNTAVRLGATVVSNSYGSFGELSFERRLEHYYRHHGVALVASTGDYGYGNGAPIIGGPAYPGVSRYVTAVGGTSLMTAANARGWTESAWAGATSGCSAYIAKPVWQHDQKCNGRTVADVAAVADPQTGVAVYDTYGYGGWLVVGGTSASAPIIAGVYALAGNASRVNNGRLPYLHRNALFDVTSGANGDNCDGTYLCTSVAGFDGPTGLGTPRGTGAF